MILALRPRIAERLERAAAFPVTLLLATAGSGKTVALQQFSTTRDVRTVDAACTASMQDLAGKLDVALVQAADATVVVDHVQAIQSDAACLKLLLDRIAATTPAQRWILASRSSAGLPVGVWLSYGMCDGVIASHDLAFTAEELAAAATAASRSIEADDVRELAEYTEGWAAAVGIALRALAGGERSRWRADVREAAYHLYDERAYPEIVPPARDLLAVAAALPQIDVPLLEAAGFQDARRILEDVRKRTGLLSEESAQAYRAPQLFREYLRRQLDLRSADERGAAFRTAAGALESAGRIDAALDAYGQARARDDLLRLLEAGGFDLLERGEAGAITRAIDVLSDAQKRTNPCMLALRGALESLRGNAIRAENLLRRALSRAGDDRELFATLSLRLALVYTNRGDPNDAILFPVIHAPGQTADNRAEAWSLLAATYALANRVEDAKNAMEEVGLLFTHIDSDPVRARILQRTGVAAIYTGQIDKARSVLSEAAELSLELGLFSLASRAYANLSNIMLHRFDDFDWQLWYAQQAADAAARAGNQFDVETALLQLLNAELRLGRRSNSYDIENRILKTRSLDQSRAHYLAPSRALLLAWDARFGEAHSVLAPSWPKLHHALDRAISAAECALYLAMDGRRDYSISTTRKAIGMLNELQADGLFYLRSIGVARTCCAIAEAVSGRQAHADRLLLQISTGHNDPVVSITRMIGEEFIASTRRRNRSGAETNRQMNSLIDRLSPLGYAHIARLFDSANATLEARKSEASPDSLSSAQLAILQAMAEGYTPKEIALRRGSSINTVRKHIARAIAKLHCSGHAETIAQARRMGLLS